jgi:oligoribonuclease NrnB/cAMP/cGMP phosphodiesterase (DHH superfamily)
VCSGAIAKRYIGGNVKVIFSDPRYIAHTLNSVDDDPENIIITDISLNHDKAEQAEIALKKIKSKVLWVDHHEWNREDIETISKLCTLHVESSPSAASLFYRLYMVDDPVSKEIAKIGDDADTNTNALENTLSYKLGISQKGGKFYLLRAFSHGEFEPERLDGWKEELQKQIKEAEKIVENLAVLTTTSGKRFTIIDMRGKQASGTYTAKLASEKLNLDFCAVIYNCRSVSFYRGIRDVNLLPVALKHNGGGHRFACGANPKVSLIERIMCWARKNYITGEINQIIEDTKKLL